MAVTYPTHALTGLSWRVADRIRRSARPQPPGDKSPPCRPLPSPPRFHIACRLPVCRPRESQDKTMGGATAHDGNLPPLPSLPHAANRRG